MSDDSDCDSDTPSLLSESSDDSSGQLKPTKVKPQPIINQQTKPKTIIQEKSDKPIDKTQAISILQQLIDEINKTDISKS